MVVGVHANVPLPPVLKSVPQPKRPEAQVSLPVVESQAVRLAPNRLVVDAVVAKREVEVALVESKLVKVEVAVEVAVNVPTVSIPTDEVAEIVPPRN